MPGLMELQVKIVSALVNKGVSLSTSGRLSENCDRSEGETD